MPTTPHRSAPAGGRAPHRDVAGRFRHFLEACSLDRDAFVAGVDGAIEARTLYPILAGERRPSRAVAVLIERTWGFRADYLLDGEEPAWTEARSAPPIASTRTTAVPDLTGFESDLIEFVRRSFDNVHSMRLDLARGRLWERLFQRTASLLDSLDATTDDGAPAASIGAVFDDCLRAAAAFERYTLAIQRRRTLQLTLAYFDAYLAPAGGPDRGGTARGHARTALRAAEQRVADCEDALARILDLPNPLDILDPDPHRAFDALAAIVSSAVPA